MSNDNEMIHSVTAVTTQGVSAYRVGMQVNGVEIHSIETLPVYLNPDPFLAYAGKCINGNVIFRVHCETPCDVTYVASS